jgi:hypothetical protein
MKTCLAILISAALLQQSSTHYYPVATTTHPVATLATEIRIPETSASCTFNTLVAIGLENHIPMGIIVGDTPDTEICKTPLNLKQKTMTVAELIADLKIALPHYQADLQNGELEISPAKLPQGTAQYLELKIAHFQSKPDSHAVLALTLWMSIQRILAPDANINFDIFSSGETVPVIDVSNQDVKTILNMIVDKGNGGVWILQSSKIKSLTHETGMPFEIYGYGGGGPALAEHLTCLK